MTQHNLFEDENTRPDKEENQVFSNEPPVPGPVLPGDVPPVVNVGKEPDAAPRAWENERLQNSPAPFTGGGATSVHPAPPEHAAGGYGGVPQGGMPHNPPAHGWSGPPPYTTGGISGHAAPVPENRDKRKRTNPLALVALVVVCAMMGFLGGYFASELKNPTRPAVVYQTVEQQARPAGEAEALSVSDIAAKAGESVVSITTENVTTDRFFGSQVVSGAGSGVIITEDGYIVTNNHVVAGATNLLVTLPDGTEAPATLVGTDPRSDIAVIKIEGTGLVPAVAGSMQNVRVGDFCLAIGNPMGQLGGTVTDGIISALNRELTIDGTTMSLMQMSAAVSPGNSGGGLFNAGGELVGVVNAKAGSENTEGLGFAIPVDTAMDVAQQLIENGFVGGRPLLGIAALQVEVQGTEGRTAVLVEEVAAGGAAELCGIQNGDLLLELNGQAITTLGELSSVLQTLAPGETVAVVVQRDNEKLQLEATLQEDRSDFPQNEVVEA